VRTGEGLRPVYGILQEAATLESKRKNDRLPIDEDKKSYYMFNEITLMKTYQLQSV